MRAFLPALVVLFAFHSFGQEFTVHKEMVAMRDGVKLVTDVYLPASGGRHPVLVSRTPYGRSGSRPDEYLVRHGYAVLIQDCRGRFDSQGDFYAFVNERCSRLRIRPDSAS